MLLSVRHSGNLRYRTPFVLISAPELRQMHVKVSSTRHNDYEQPLVLPQFSQR